MIKRLFDKCIIKPGDVKPSHEDFKVICTNNPGVVEFGETTYFLIRVSETPKEERDNHVALPKAENGKTIIDWKKEEETIAIPEGGVLLKKGGFSRLNKISHLRLAKSRDGINIDSIDEKPTIFPEEYYEEFGIEDARITPIDDKFYITYVAVSRLGITTALASTKDFVHFERHGIIFPTENKDAVIFPEKINGSYFALHRPKSDNPFGIPEIWMADSPNLTHWGNHHCAIGVSPDCCSLKLRPKTQSNQKSRKIHRNSLSAGAGTPPIRTEEGWLEIYHESSKENKSDKLWTYSAKAALFNLNNPHELLGISEEPILIPEKDYETLHKGYEYGKDGYLPNIVFPTGIVAKGDTLYIYSGASDTFISVAQLSLKDVINSISVPELHPQ